MLYASNLMTLPLSPEDNQVQSRRTRVIVIEDNEDLAKLFCDLLEVMGCSTQAAFNARTALEYIRSDLPDLVFCDLRLPGEKNGFDVARELRADPVSAHIPLIAVTGFDDPVEHQRAMQAGFEQVFDKPVKFSQIQGVLNGYLKRAASNQCRPE